MDCCCDDTFRCGLVDCLCCRSDWRHPDGSVVCQVAAIEEHTP